MPYNNSANAGKTVAMRDFLQNRELGYKHYLGFEDELQKKLISSLSYCDNRTHDNEGGIFSLEFSLDGSILAAACEKNSIILHDALNRREIKTIEDAHLNCVNCIRFLDSHTFVTGSDDNTVRTWDIRFLKSPVRVLLGHSNWVKNIEYSAKEKKLLTSAFDGSIFAWDLNNYTEQGALYDKVFEMDGLMRSKLTPDDSKLVISTTTGYLLIIHNLHLETLQRDLRRFKPNIYRLMQASEQAIPIAARSNRLFSPYRRVNRVELISDFPNSAEVISSLKIHPMGWCALTRNISSDESSEWTCVHDIQERDAKDYLTAYTYARMPQVPPINRSVDEQNQNSLLFLGHRHTPMDLWVGFVSNQNIRAQRLLSSANRRGSGIRTSRTAITVFNSGILSHERLAADAHDLLHRVQVHSHSRPEPSTETDDEQEVDTPAGHCRIIQNLSRLTHYMAEPNAGKGFIKELCFSADGRIICSPYNTGVRLFAFNSSCNELSACVPDRPERLHKVASFTDCHSEVVVSCKFNPYHCMLVSGCLGGKIVWYHPVL